MYLSNSIRLIVGVFSFFAEFKDSLVEMNGGGLQREYADTARKVGNKGDSRPNKIQSGDKRSEDR